MVLLSPRTVLAGASLPRLVGWVILPEGKGRRRGFAPFTAGLQFSLSESPEGDLIRPSLRLVLLSCRTLPGVWSLARLELALPSLGFFPVILASRFEEGVLRLLLFVLRAELLVERRRLIAARAEPLDSFSAWAVNSSRASESQQNSQVRVSLELPEGSRGGSGALGFAAEAKSLGGKLIGKAL